MKQQGQQETPANDWLMTIISGTHATICNDYKYSKFDNAIIISSNLVTKATIKSLMSVRQQIVKRKYW